MQLYACAGTILCSYALVPLYMHNCTHLCSCTVMQSCACTLVRAPLHTLVQLCPCALVLAQLHTIMHACFRACTILCSCSIMHLCGCACTQLCSCALVQMMLMESTACSRRRRYEPCFCHHGLRASRKPVPGACASSRCPVHGCSRCQS